VKAYYKGLTKGEVAEVTDLLADGFEYRVNEDEVALSPAARACVFDGSLGISTSRFVARKDHVAVYARGYIANETNPEERVDEFHFSAFFDVRDCAIHSEYVTFDAGHAVAQEYAARVEQCMESFPNKNIVEVVEDAGDFATLLAAVELAGLDLTRKELTLFAPTDAAFDALPEGVIDALLLDENRDQLISVLAYHVIHGAKVASELLEENMVKTVQGLSVNVTQADDSSLMVDDATVTEGNHFATNGVIHVVDTVLVPADLQL
jgi:uncharacterized surface protein with fasciclin (FAS1) repeats